jgi:hypothetical protein
MRQHTWIGSNILKDSTSVIFQAGSVVTLSHHERWDGSGYLQNSKGEDIPVSDRICALADVFDALTTSRAYKKEIPVWDPYNSSASQPASCLTLLSSPSSSKMSTCSCACCVIIRRLTTSSPDRTSIKRFR